MPIEQFQFSVRTSTESHYKAANQATSLCKGKNKIVSKYVCSGPMLQSSCGCNYSRYDSSTERWNIQSANPITLFTHFKTNTKSIDIHRVLRCSVLMKKSKHCGSNEMGQANQRPYISLNDEHSIPIFHLSATVTYIPYILNPLRGQEHATNKCKCPNETLTSHCGSVGDPSARVYGSNRFSPWDCEVTLVGGARIPALGNHQFNWPRMNKCIIRANKMLVVKF